jgi:hypothetical protein
MLFEEASKGSSGWLPFLTAVVGFASSQLLEWLKDRRAYIRDQKTRDDSKRDAWVQRRNAFQTQTLLDLQDETAKWIRCVREVHFLQTSRSDAVGEWPNIPYPAELSDRLGEATSRTIMLNARIRDGGVRDTVKQLRDELGKVIWASNKSDSIRWIEASSITFEVLNERIGVLLRDLDLFESSN